MKIVVLTGAGISAESGISTFRDSNGLWENHDIEEVATPSGWCLNPELVTRFYNQRRAQLHTVHPNDAHHALVELAKYHDVSIITQNVDDLHERAGSKNVMHLHGELLKSRDEETEETYEQLGDMKYGDKSPSGNLLRPHIVWFFEAVPKIIDAQKEVQTADKLIVIGTSLQVYPAAGLLEFAPEHCEVILIDPVDPDTRGRYRFLQGTASEQVPALVHELI